MFNSILFLQQKNLDVHLISPLPPPQNNLLMLSIVAASEQEKQEQQQHASLLRRKPNLRCSKPGRDDYYYDYDDILIIIILMSWTNTYLYYYYYHIFFFALLLLFRNHHPATLSLSLSGHSSRQKESIQRHTCSKCFNERAHELVANQNLTRWDVACVLAKEFRNYFCCCCILEACVDKNFARVCHRKYCRNGHKFICRQQYCVAHNKRLTVCRLCPDPRAGSSYRLCGVLRSRKCNCSAEDHLLGIIPQEKEVIESKESYAKAMLDRARDMAAAASSSSYSSALLLLAAGSATADAVTSTTSSSSTTTTTSTSKNNNNNNVETESDNRTQSDSTSSSSSEE